MESAGGRMRRPVSIWLVALVLAAYGAYGAWAAVAVRYWAPGVMGLLALAGAAGLLLGKGWSRFCVYLVALLVVASWGYSIWIVARVGGPFPDLASVALAFVPGALLAVLCAGSSVVVFRYFRRPSD